MADEPVDIVLQHLIAIREDITAIRATLVELGDGQTVLGNMIIRLKTDMVQVKRILSQMDVRIAHLEKAAPA